MPVEEVLDVDQHGRGHFCLELIEREGAESVMLVGDKDAVALRHLVKLDVLDAEIFADDVGREQRIAAEHSHAETLQVRQTTKLGGVP